MKRYAANLVLMAVALTYCAANAHAHRVIEDDGSHTTAENAIILEDFELSQVVYHEVTDSSNHLWFRFEATEGQILYWEFGLPSISRLQNYRPEMVVLGPGLPDISLPFDVPDGLGGLVVENGAQLEDFFERFTGTNTWILSNEEQRIEQAGTYYVVAYHPDDTPGKFWVALGKREEFGLADVLGYAETLFFVRNYHEDSVEPLSSLNRRLLRLSLRAQFFFALFIGNWPTNR
jgi:hypothetical protein